MMMSAQRMLQRRGSGPVSEASSMMMSNGRSADCREGLIEGCGIGLVALDNVNIWKIERLNGFYVGADNVALGK